MAQRGLRPRCQPREIDAIVLDTEVVAEQTLVPAGDARRKLGGVDGWLGTQRNVRGNYRWGDFRVRNWRPPLVIDEG